MSTPMAGMFQFIENNLNQLVAVPYDSLVASVAEYAGAEVTANTEHVQEGIQMLAVKAITEVNLSPSAVTYYYFFDSNNNAFFVIAGPAGMVVADQTQYTRAQLQLLLDVNGRIIAVGSCFVTDLAFPPASPFAQEFI